MEITATGLAALIASISFAVLVVGLIIILLLLVGVLSYVLLRVVGLVSKLGVTVDKLNKRLDPITGEAIYLLTEVNRLLKKLNLTVDDILPYETDHEPEPEDKQHEKI